MADQSIPTIQQKGTNVGIGTANPQFAGGGGLQINTNGTDTRLHLTNTTTGVTGTDGFELALVGNDIYYDSKESSGSQIFYTAGSERMRITSGGNVGIGTSSPNVTGFGGATALTIAASIQPVLELIGSAYNATGVFGGGVVQFRNSSTAVATLGVENLTGNQGNMVFYTNNGSTNAERMRITSGGNVGIGTTSPGDSRLQINGTHPSGNAIVRIQAVSDDTASLGLFGTSGTRRGLLYYSAGIVALETNSDPLMLATNGTERMRITSGGSVGIGTTSPNTRLDVYDSDNSGARTSPINILTITADNNSNPYDGFGGGLLFKNRIYSGGPSAGGIRDGARIRTSLRTNSVVNFGTELLFDVTTSGSGSLTEILRLSYTDGATFSSSVTAGAYTANGSITASSPIDTGGTKAYFNASSINGAALTLVSDSVGRTLRLSSNTSGSSIAAIDANANGLFIGTNTYHPILFGPNATERMRITANGEVGIGVTPSTGNRFWVRGSDSTASNTSLITQNSSGTITMIVRNDGNVGIGTTSPLYILDAYSTGASTARLRVQGTTNFALTQAQNSSGVLYMGIDSSTADGFGVGNYSRLIWSSNAYPLVFAVNDAERMRITSGGNVGIGTTSPEAIFHVARANTGGIGGQVVIDNPAGSTVGNSVEISFLTDAGASGSSIRNARILAVNENAGNGAARLEFHTWSGSISAERLRISSDGAITQFLSTGGAAFGNGINISTQQGTYTSGHGGILQFQNEDVITAGIRGIRTTGWGSAMVFYVHNESAGNTFGTTFAERMRITEGGAVCINTTSPFASGVLSVNGIGAFGALYAGSLGTGTVYSNGGTLTNTNPSDRRLKTNIIPLSYGLADILKLNPVSYNWKDGTNGKQFGFIAQDVQEVMPDAVKNGEYLGLEKDAIYSALVNAVKELKAELDTLKNK